MPRKLGVGVLFLLFGCIAMAQDFNGKWKADFSTERGAQKYVFDFHVDGTKLTGKVISDRHGETEIRDGKVDGNNVTFTEIVQANGQEVKVSYTGKINGNEIRFSRQFGEFHTEELTAERVKEPVHP
jgi:hypothetical protein